MNFLALLGWSPGNDQELFSRDELVAAFSLEGISGSNAVFNPEKLEWFSAQHIARMPAAELVRRIEPRLRDAGLWRGEFDGDAGRAWLGQVVELLRPRAKRLTDFVEKGRPFLVDELEYDAEAVKKHLSSPDALAHLAAVRDACAGAQAFTAVALEPAIRALAEARGVKAGVLIHPTRVAVVGRADSPGIFEVLELLGRDRVLVAWRTRCRLSRRPRWPTCGGQPSPNASDPVRGLRGGGKPFCDAIERRSIEVRRIDLPEPPDANRGWFDHAIRDEPGLHDRHGIAPHRDHHGNPLVRRTRHQEASLFGGRVRRRVSACPAHGFSLATPSVDAQREMYGQSSSGTDATSVAASRICNSDPLSRAHTVSTAADPPVRPARHRRRRASAGASAGTRPGDIPSPSER